MIPNKIRKCSCIYIYRKCASSAKLSVLQKKCECTCKTVEKRWRIHVHANNKINTFYFRMHCKFSKTIRIWKNKILSSLTNAIYFFINTGYEEEKWIFDLFIFCVISMTHHSRLNVTSVCIDLRTTAFE